MNVSQGVAVAAPPREPSYPLHQERWCLVCGTALAGPLGALFRVFGIRRSSRNPNICSRCNTHAEEGRLVNLTVLFADLSNFTELTHELGPERTHEVVDAFLRGATYALVKHGAFIDKYIGDAVMAFFNVPIRYDDHSARAVAAALEIQAELPALSKRFGIDLRSSIGIASGWARVGRLGSADGRDYTAIGDVVNLAARLEAQARPGEMVVHGDVYQQVAAEFPAVPAEALQLKGFTDPIPARRLGAVAGELPTEPRPRLRSRRGSHSATGDRASARSSSRCSAHPAPQSVSSARSPSFSASARSSASWAPASFRCSTRRRCASPC